MLSFQYRHTLYEGWCENWWRSLFWTNYSTKAMWNMKNPISRHPYDSIEMNRNQSNIYSAKQLNYFDSKEWFGKLKVFHLLLLYYNQLLKTWTYSQVRFFKTPVLNSLTILLLVWLMELISCFRWIWLNSMILSKSTRVELVFSLLKSNYKIIMEQLTKQKAY